MSISFGARQKFRQRLQSIEKADEILDSLDNFVDRFQLINESFSSNSFELAASKLSIIRHRLLTETIRKGWIAKLQANYYNE